MNEKPESVVKQVLRYRRGITLLSVGRLIPKDWNYVRIHTLKKTQKYMVIKIDKIEV